MNDTLSTDEVWRMVNEILAEFGLPAARALTERSSESEPVLEVGTGVDGYRVRVASARGRAS